MAFILQPEGLIVETMHNEMSYLFPMPPNNLSTICSIKTTPN